MRFVALFPMFARVELIIFGMIFLLLPAMTLHAPVLIWAAVFVVVDELSWTPISALIFGIDIELRLSSEVLPVMCEHTLVSLVIVFVIGAPYCFKVKHIEVRISFKLINQLNRYLGITMREWAVVTVFTFACSIDIGSAKLGLIFIWMVKLFNSVVCLLAFISFGTLSSSYNVMTHLRLVRTERSSLVFFLIMIIWTSFKIMAVWINFAGMHFEQS